MESEKRVQIIAEGIVSFLDLYKRMVNNENIPQDELQKAKQRFNELIGNL